MKLTQVSFGNLPHDVEAKELANFLEDCIGLVMQCKVKKVSNNVPPHAFVQFESPKVAKMAHKMANKHLLIFRNEWHLKSYMDDRGWMNGCRGLNTHIQLFDVRVELGSITGPKHMYVSWRGPAQGMIFRVEPIRKCLRFFFSESIELKGSSVKTKCNVMLEVHQQEVRAVQELEHDVVDSVLLLKLWSPPSIFYRTANDDIYEYICDPSQIVDDEDPWIRCVDFVTPNKSIGRCLDYRITVSARQRTMFNKFKAFFEVRGILEISTQLSYTLFSEENSNPSSDSDLFTVSHKEAIPFDVMFLVNALVHRGIIHLSALSSSFYELLHPNITPIKLSTFVLTHMLTYKQQVFDVVKSFQSLVTWAKSECPKTMDSNLMDGKMLIRRLIITPTRAFCLPPEIELSNRVIRHFKLLSDRFLRVSFLDEDSRSIPPASLSIQVAPIVRAMSEVNICTRTTIYNRIVKIMTDGFNLCGRHYCFLAFSTGQLRESSAWFFAADSCIGVKQIRQWMGHFPGGIVAKHAARMGQCFSATYSTLEVLHDEVLSLPDIKRKNYDFSDGCGKINSTFSALVAKVLRLGDNPPSAYQIRYAGYKGVVAMWPIESKRGRYFKLALRQSMRKFLSMHCQLEIVGWSKFLPCFLNRQIITLLSTLHVDDNAFIELQEDMVRKLNHMVNDQLLAYSVLVETYGGELYNTPIKMLRAGFDPQTETHLRAMLLAIRAGQLEELVKKTKIFLPNGRWLMGCLDEIGCLEYGQCFVHVSNPPSGCAQEKRSCKVITGKVIMTKNPCMHPGDIRILEAVDNPELHHLVDCLVVPQKGPRPHPNEASGSDLDGDVYFVSWDKNIFPPSGKSWEPMDYVSQEAKPISIVKTEHLIEFFVKHMVNDSLGKICNAHVVHADRSSIGALDKNCLCLAKLAAKAVDYPKTGKPAVMPFELKPKMYPDFMEKESGISYESQKIIGKLFRMAQGTPPQDDVYSNVNNTFQKFYPIYDPDLEATGFESYLDVAWQTKQLYDLQLQQIMTQFDVQNESEVVTGHVILESKTTRKHGDVKENVKLAYLSLQKRFASMLVEGYKELRKCKGLDFRESNDNSDEFQQVIASAWYHVTYHHEWYVKSQKVPHVNPNHRPFLSFPWIGVEQLIAIKTKKLTLGF